MNRTSYCSNTKPRDTTFALRHGKKLAVLGNPESNNPRDDETLGTRKEIFQGHTKNYEGNDIAKSTCKFLQFSPRVTICSIESMPPEDVNRMWYVNEDEQEFLKNVREEVKYLRRKLKNQSLKSRNIKSQDYRGTTLRGIEHFLVDKEKLKEVCDEQSSVIRGVLDTQDFLKALPDHHFIDVDHELAAVSSSRSRNAILRAYKNARRDEDDYKTIMFETN